MTAHPKIDPATGKMHFFGYGFVPPYLTYHVAAADGTLEYSAEVAVSGPTMMHDFAITESDAIFWELPVVFDLEAAVAALSPDAPADGSGFPFQWDPSYGARIGIMPLEGPTSAIRWVEIDPCYVFHGVNAHRDGDDVVLHVNQLDSAFGPDGDLVDSRLHEWRIGTGGDALTLGEFVEPQRAELDDARECRERAVAQPLRCSQHAAVESADRERKASRRLRELLGGGRLILLGHENPLCASAAAENGSRPCDDDRESTGRMPAAQVSCSPRPIRPAPARG
jgi:hypothetical protein